MKALARGGGKALGSFLVASGKSVVSESYRRADRLRNMANFFARSVIVVQVAVLCALLGIFLFFLVWTLFH